MGKSQSPKRKRDGHLKRKYGITPDDYDNMFYAQDGACAICREEPKAETRLHVDHDHNTSAVRGLLCGTCNKGIGLFRDSRQLLFQAVEYLDSHAFTGTTEKP